MSSSNHGEQVRSSAAEMLERGKQRGRYVGVPEEGDHFDSIERCANLKAEPAGQMKDEERSKRADPEYLSSVRGGD